jgi:peptidase E
MADQPSLDEEPRRILLTSNGVSNPSIARDLVALLRSRKPEGNPKVMYVPDAGVGNGGNVNAMFQHARMMLSKVGVSQVICTELRTTTPASLATQLNGVDMIYCDMGNTFYLRHQMRTSGFDRLVPQLVKEFGVVWFGSSSGSICAGRTISTALWKGWDDPGQGKEWDQTRTDYAGLDLLSGKSFFPHFGPQFGALVETRRRDLDHELVVIEEETAYIEGVQDLNSPRRAQQSIRPGVLRSSSHFSSQRRQCNTNRCRCTVVARRCRRTVVARRCRHTVVARQCPPSPLGEVPRRNMGGKSR